MVKKKTQKQEEKNKGGRPSKLTDEVVENFTAAISIGNTYRTAAHYAKISEEAAQLWMRIGREEYALQEAGKKTNPKNEKYLRFLMAVREAETDAIVEWQTVLNQSARSDPNWAFKMLKLRTSDGYNENDMTQHISIPVDMSVEYLDRIIAGENPVVVIKEWREHSATKSASPETKKTSGE